MDSFSDEKKDVIGKRIYSDGFLGTVLYSGEVEGTTGFWFGVEWDDAKRGKHNGAYKGKRYFETKSPTSGSFTRVEKIHFGSPFPKVFKTSLNIDVQSPEPETLKATLFINTLKPIEMIGFEQDRRKKNYSTLTELSLHQKQISSAGDTSQISDYTPNLRSLDLSSNLLNNWDDVAVIFSSFPKLTSLNLRENKLQVPPDAAALESKFETLEELILNKTNYCWEQILTCSTMWPNLVHLEVWQCDVTNLSPLNGHLQNLQRLNLASNSLSTWSQVCFLGELQHLQSLFLDTVGLEDINFPQTQVNTATSLFPSLKFLSLTNNKLSKWRDVAELTKLPQLVDLRINHNPIWKSELAATSEQIVVAKLPKLKFLNKMEITSKERRGAELDYLKRYCLDWLKSGGKRDSNISNPSVEFREEHPSYEHLVALHGPSEEGEISKTSQSFKSNLIAINIEAPKSNKLLTKKLPPTMTVGKLKALIRNLFRISTQDMKLTYIDSKNSNIEMDIDKDLRQLSYYSLASGDKILVDW